MRGDILGRRDFAYDLWSWKQPLGHCGNRYVTSATHGSERHPRVIASAHRSITKGKREPAEGERATAPHGSERPAHISYLRPRLPTSARTLSRPPSKRGGVRRNHGGRQVHKPDVAPLQQHQRGAEGSVPSKRGGGGSGTRKVSGAGTDVSVDVDPPICAWHGGKWLLAVAEVNFPDGVNPPWMPPTNSGISTCPPVAASP